jgi:hypothetical protein
MGAVARRRSQAAAVDDFTALCSHIAKLCSHVSSVIAHMLRRACCRCDMTMPSLCLLALTVAIATLATPVVVQIMWNKIEGRTVAKGLDK